MSRLCNECRNLWPETFGCNICPVCQTNPSNNHIVSPIAHERDGINNYLRSKREAHKESKKKDDYHMQLSLLG
ncbi:MAG: hypothetical protein K0R93_697 [Anaerosolibacter sp.]|jgi:hypothetical protein|nr:hypothetical protein [Anaerosolibacter sp.]